MIVSGIGPRGQSGVVMYTQSEVRKVPNLAMLIAKDIKHGKCGQPFANCNCKKGAK